MPLSKKRKITVPQETSTEESHTPRSPTLQDTNPAQAGVEQEEPREKQVSEEMNRDEKQTAMNEERQQRFKALQARAVSP